MKEWLVGVFYFVCELMSQLERIRTLYQELGGEIKSEISKASQMLWFLGILVFVALGRLIEYDVVWKVVMTILLVITVGSLFFTILWKWYLGHPSLDSLWKEQTIADLENNYRHGYRIWRQKHRLNFLNLFLVVITLLYVLVLLFFVG